MTSQMSLASKKPELVVKAPSEELQAVIKKAASYLRKGFGFIGEAIRLGEQEGFDKLEIGDLIRKELIAMGYSRMTASRALPAEFKHKPRGNPGGNKPRLRHEPTISNKMLLTTGDERQPEPETVVPVPPESEQQQQPESQPEPDYKIPPENYDIDDVEQYDKPLLVNIIKMLHEKLQTMQQRCHVWLWYQSVDNNNIL